MHLIFGVISLDGADINPDWKQSWIDSMDYIPWAPSQIFTFVNGFLGHKSSDKPLSKPFVKDSWSIVSDARVDNRLALYNQLNVKGLNDTELILEAYLRWGEQCSKHLLGDYSAVIYNKKNSTLFLLTDHMGVKPLYYTLHKNTIWFANAIHPFRKCKYLNFELSYEGVAHHLFFYGSSDPRHTYCEEVKRVHPGAYVTCNNKQLKENIYWSQDKRDHVTFKHFDEWKAYAQELLHDSISLRMHGTGNVASQFTGGFDSSFVTLVAKENLQHDRTLYPYRMNLEIDITAVGDSEYNFAQQLAQQHKLKLINIEPVQADMEQDDFYKTYDVFSFENYSPYRHRILKEILSPLDVKTVLTGFGGDQMLSYRGQAHYMKLLHQGRIKTIWQDMSNEIDIHHSGYNKVRQILGNLLYEAIAPNVPKLIKRGLYRTNIEALKRLKPFLQQPFYEYVCKQLHSNNQTKLFMNPHWNLENRYLYDRPAFQHNHGLLHQIEFRYPLLDKRVIELALDLPFTYYRLNGRRRHFFREVAKPYIMEIATQNYSKPRGYTQADLDKLHEKKRTRTREILQKVNKNLPLKQLQSFIAYDQLKSKEAYEALDNIALYKLSILSYSLMFNSPDSI